MWKQIIFGTLACTLAACAGGPSSVERMSDAEYLNASPEEQSEYLASLESESFDVLSRKHRAELLSGKEVSVGDKRTGMVMQCHPLPGNHRIVTYYPRHNPPGLSYANTAGFGAYKADKSCNVAYERSATGQMQPVQLFANVANQQDFLRMMANTVVASTANGLGAAFVNNLMSPCRDGQCANSNVIINEGAEAVAAAATESNTASQVTVEIGGLCPSGTCARAPTK